ncbi:ABC transporter permease [Larkinella terrae]|uniref:FtsX-like permease family protein n=1 Tax=Larkinella terrae TaxID=2025311 RepID=A0A7K0EQX4_9BACT|nr:ABC transporter permease [Larkinella terrae]MRS64235.1 FtsX-like permease family protein [Larkinella terrae]
MLSNYLKIALRNLWRNKFYTGLNVVGLAVGLAACLLMALYVNHEFSYDGFHTKADRIVRVTTEMKTPESPLSIASSPLPLATVLKQDYPEVETAVRLLPASAMVRHRDKLLKEPDIYFADKDVFTVFTYSFLAGNPASALANPNSAVITERFAKKYFGKTDVLGKTVELNKQLYQITGVVADPPSNTDLPVTALLSKTFTGARSWVEDDFPCYTYVLFREEPNLAVFSKKLAQLAEKYANPELKKMGAEGYSLVLPVERLQDVHYSTGKLADTPKGNKQYGYLFAFLAVFVLIIALLNYINLLTARATERAKEVGIRKANGARRGQLIRQFLFESLLLSGLSVAIAVVLVYSMIPFFNELLQIRLSIVFSEAVSLSGFTWLLVTLAGGLYPAFVLSNYRPVEVLKGRVGSFGKGAWLRQSVIVFQFMLAVGMITGVLVIRRQMNFMQQHDLGFRKESILSVYLPEDSTARAAAGAFAASLKNRSEVGEVTIGSGLQPSGLLPMASTTIRTNGKKREIMSNYQFIDDQFLPLLNIKLKTGRNLSANIKSDLNGGFIVNEAFVKMAGWKDGIGQTIDGFNHKGKVVGVVRNFHYRSLHNLVEPLVLVYNTFPANSLMLKVKAEDLPAVKAVWERYYPLYPFDYAFLEQSFESQYRKDRTLATIFNGFTSLTILVSCLGLFGFITFTTGQRTKEIGIRKILGASVVNVVLLLSKDFLKLVIIAFVIAAPVAWFALDRWLQDFAYRVGLEGWIFALAGSLVILIALLTVSFQSIKAALVNPVKSLKNE